MVAGDVSWYFKTKFIYGSLMDEYYYSSNTVVILKIVFLDIILFSYKGAAGIIASRIMG
jgi:hypothetical protein